MSSSLSSRKKLLIGTLVPTISLLGLGGFIFLMSLEEKGCSVDVTKLNPQPLALKSDGSTFLYPSPLSKNIHLKKKEIVKLACPTTSSKRVIEAECLEEDNFIVQQQTVKFYSLNCPGNLYHVSKLTTKSCENGGSEAEIGWFLSHLPESVFLRQIRLCFDEVTKRTLYSEFNLTEFIQTQQTRVSSPKFVQDRFFHLNKKLDDFYQLKKQRSNINRLLELSETSTKYIGESPSDFFSKGHLTAKSDFVYESQQKATFHHVNVAPQWKIFNEGNWRLVEEAVRRLADKNTLNYKVYTGTFGVISLPHEKTGQPVELYLFSDNGSKGIPIPQVFWKVVYNPDTKEGLAIIGNNNPYDPTLSEGLCKDVSEDISWIQWNSFNASSPIYACDVRELRKTINFIPKLEVNYLLK